MKKIHLYLISILFLCSCEYGNPAFRFSNFYDTQAETITKAIKKNDTKKIREEVIKKQANVDFIDEKYEVSLLALTIAKNRKKSFETLLELGANPNINNSYCVSPLITAIRYNNNCDLFFVKKLLEYDAEILPDFFKKCNSFTHGPIPETILHYNDEGKIKCGLEIIKILATKLDNPNLLYEYNNPEEYHENIIYNCISTNKNLSALKFLIVDLKYKVPEEIFINGTVLLNYDGYKPLTEILQSREFRFENSPYREKAKKEILTYLDGSK